MFKVLMLAPTPFFSDRGCHIRIYEEAKALAKLGVDLKIATYFAGQDVPGLEVVRAGKWVGYRKLAAGPSIKKPLADLALLFRARREIRKFQPDFIHCHLHEGAFVGLLAAGAGEKRVPVILDYQGSLAGELSEHHPFFRLPGISKMTGMTESAINSRVDAILLNCAALGAEIKTGLKEKCRVVGDGVDLERFCPQTADPELKRKAGLKPGLPVIVFLGLLNRYQGLDLLLKSAAILKNKKAKFQMLVMGYPIGDYPERARNLGLDELVKFSGRIDYNQAHKWLALGEVAVAPKIARSESNGKILNYLAMGIPVACFDKPVNRELAGDCAEYAGFAPGDEQKNAEALAVCLEKLLGDPGRQKELSGKSRERALEKFSWEAVAKRILAAYQELGSCRK